MLVAVYSSMRGGDWPPDLEGGTRVCRNTEEPLTSVIVAARDESFP